MREVRYVKRRVFSRDLICKVRQGGWRGGGSPRDLQLENGASAVTMRCAVVLAVLVGTSLAARIDELFRARCAAGCIDAPKKNKVNLSVKESLKHLSYNL